MKMSACVATLALLWPVAGGAQEIETWINPLTPDQTRAQWTEQRLAEARPPAMRRIDASGPRVEELRTSGGPSVGTPAGEPRRRPRRLDQTLFDPSLALPRATAPVEVISDGNLGSGKAHFSSSRLIPLAADLEYPYRTVGKLLFETPDGAGECSAAVIARRLVLTAAHCVHDGTPGGFYENFVFAPGYRDGAAPYGVWVGNVVLVHTTWANSGKVPHAVDYAVIEMADSELGRIGDVVGWLGTQTKKLLPNHVLMLGYPGNLDGGQKMHQVAAQSFKAFNNSTVLYGSDMLQGSSGGPWVQNFGQTSQGQSGGQNAGLNRVVGVTSYVATDKGVFLAGSSILDQRFTQMYNALCANRAGNCG